MSMRVKNSEISLQKKNQKSQYACEQYRNCSKKLYSFVKVQKNIFI